MTNLTSSRWFWAHPSSLHFYSCISLGLELNHSHKSIHEASMKVTKCTNKRRKHSLIQSFTNKIE